MIFRNRSDSNQAKFLNNRIRCNICNSPESMFRPYQDVKFKIPIKQNYRPICIKRKFVGMRISKSFKFISSVLLSMVCLKCGWQRVTNIQHKSNVTVIGNVG